MKGAKHQYFSPGEIPDYVPSKIYNPNFSATSEVNETYDKLFNDEKNRDQKEILKSKIFLIILDFFSKGYFLKLNNFFLSRF